MSARPGSAGPIHASLRAQPHHPPRILIVGNFLSEFAGGWGVCESLAAELRGRGFDVITTSGRKSRIARLADMMATAWRRRRDYDVAQVDVYSGPAFLWAEAVCWTLRRAGKRYVLTLHGGNLPDFARRWPRRVAALMRSAAAVTSPSGYLRERLSAWRSDIRIVPNALATRDYPFRLRKPARPTIAWLRAFGRLYNPGLAVRSLARLAAAVPEAKLSMRGGDRADGSLEAARAEAATGAAAGRVEIGGPVPKRDVPSWLDAHDVFVNTSSVDNNPVSVIEAMACGLCVVSTDVGGVPFLVEHETSGLLVPPDDADALARAVERIVRDPDLAARLSSNARRRAESADWSKVLPVWEDVFGALAEGGPA